MSPRSIGSFGVFTLSGWPDTLGDEILEVAREKRVNVEFVSRARVSLPTGTAVATVDAMGNATYELVQPVACDEITFSVGAHASSN
jgi:sugar/nucleoside kinase (ribokinase family)